jgi:hypothetical protein
LKEPSVQYCAIPPTEAVFNIPDLLSEIFKSLNYDDLIATSKVSRLFYKQSSKLALRTNEIWLSQAILLLDEVVVGKNNDTFKEKAVADLILSGNSKFKTTFVDHVVCCLLKIPSNSFHFKFYRSDRSSSLVIWNEPDKIFFNASDTPISRIAKSHLKKISNIPSLGCSDDVTPIISQMIKDGYVETVQFILLRNSLARFRGRQMLLDHLIETKQPKKALAYLHENLMQLKLHKEGDFGRKKSDYLKLSQQYMGQIIALL